MRGDGVRIAIACEDQAHRWLVTSLADRVILDEATRASADWIEPASLDWYRTYGGRGDTGHLPEHRRFYPLSQASRDAVELPYLRWSMMTTSRRRWRTFQSRASGSL